ncbi:MAG TPA: 50S ribosomal protein L11 methyltransferase [Conexibacter sp.]|nr:50S ribosomal protein L11 methyltransferase [Conexibacter sp.]
MIRLALRVDRAHAEIALAELLELAPGGVEEVDLGDAVEYAVYGPPGELPVLPDLEAAVGGALIEVTTSELPDDWSERWKQFHHPLVLGERLAVRPPWEQPVGTDVELVIDPAQAFGTGAHATTRLCLELLLSLADARAERGRLLDLGCGSGVLAIAAAKLGFEPVAAVDFDPLSVEATAANAVVNDVTLEVARCDLRSDAVPAAPIVLANLLRPLLLDYARLLGSAGGPDAPHTLIASGLLVHEADEIAAAFAALGLREQDRRERGEWAALLLSRRA